MFRCRLYRALISHAIDDDEPLPIRARHHVGQCPDCHAFWNRSRQLTRLLSEPPERIDPSPFLNSRIAAALEQVDIEMPQARFTPSWIAAAVAGVATVVVIALILTPGSDKMDGPNAGGLSTDSALIERTSILLDGQTLLDLGQTIDQPLQQEIRLVLADAKAAVQVLAENFLPQRLLDDP